MKKSQIDTNNPEDDSGSHRTSRTKPAGLFLHFCSITVDRAGGARHIPLLQGFLYNAQEIVFFFSSPSSLASLPQRICAFSCPHCCRRTPLPLLTSTSSQVLPRRRRSLHMHILCRSDGDFLPCCCELHLGSGGGLREPSVLNRLQGGSRTTVRASAQVQVQG